MEREDGTFSDHGDYRYDSLDSLRTKILHMHKFFSGEMPDFLLDKDLLDEARHDFRSRAMVVTQWALRLFQADGAGQHYYDHRQGKMRLARWMKHLWMAYDAHDAWTRQTDMMQDLMISMRWVRQMGYMRQIMDHVGKLVNSAHVLTRLLRNPEDGCVDTTRPIQQWMERNFIRQHEGLEQEDESQRKRNKSLANKIVHHCLDYANRRGLCWRNGYVYQERKVEFAGGVYGTRTYQYLCWDDEEGRRDGRESTVEEFVVRVCTKETVYEYWEALLDGRMKNNVVNFLKVSREREFPELRPLRNLLAFRNGIYDTEAPGRGSFYTYDHVGSYFRASQVACKYFDVEIDAASVFDAISLHQGAWFDGVKTPLFQGILDYQNYGGPTTQESRRRLEERLDLGQAPLVEAVCDTRRHLQCFMQAAEDAVLAANEMQRADEVHETLATVLENCDRLRANFEATLRALEPASRAASLTAGLREPQSAPADVSGASAGALPQEASTARRLPPEVQKWVYIFMGRLLHDLGWDNWQIVPFIKGVAGTGKSLIAQVAMHFFDAQDVGILGSSIEPIFGLSALAEKFMYVCLEVKKNFSLDQSLFQSMVSGEQVSVAVKGKTAYSKKWTAPGILCGNEWASYKDSQGSIARRLAIVNFPFPVAQRDSNPNLLREILETELATLIMKCNTAYLEMAEIQKKSSIWKILPAYFSHQQKALQIDSDPLMALLSDSTIFVQDPCAWVSWAKFQKEYQLKCRELRGSDYHEALIDDKLRPALKEFNAQKVHDTRADFAMGGDPVHCHWIVGLRCANDSAAAARPQA